MRPINTGIPEAKHIFILRAEPTGYTGAPQTNDFPTAKLYIYGKSRYSARGSPPSCRPGPASGSCWPSSSGQPVTLLLPAKSQSLHHLQHMKRFSALNPTQPKSSQRNLHDRGRGPPSFAGGVEVQPHGRGPVPAGFGLSEGRVHVKPDSDVPSAAALWCGHGEWGPMPRYRQGSPLQLHTFPRDGTTGWGHRSEEAAGGRRLLEVREQLGLVSDVQRGRAAVMEVCHRENVDVLGPKELGPRVNRQNLDRRRGLERINELLRLVSSGYWSCRLLG